METEDFELDPTKHKVILLLATGLSVREITKKTGMSSSTINRMKADPNCRKKLSEAIDVIFHSGLSKLSLGVEIAINKLIEIIESEETPDRTKLRAIEVLLNSSINFSRHEYEVRPIPTIDNGTRLKGWDEKEVHTSKSIDGEKVFDDSVFTPRFRRDRE